MTPLQLQMLVVVLLTGAMGAASGRDPFAPMHMRMFALLIAIVHGLTGLYLVLIW